MKKIQLFYIAFILLLFGGCTDEVSGVLDDSPINRDGSIAFRMDSVITRGTPQDNVLNYSKVNLIAYSHTGKYADGKSQYRRIDLTKDGSNTPPTWDYSPHMFWPEGRGLSFLGYTIESTFTYATATGKEGVFVKENGPTAAPTIEYIVPTDVGKQPDLIVTAQLDHPKSQNVTLIMKHALSCVSFCATAPLGANGKVMKVKSLKINNIYTKGTFLLDDPSIKWTLDPDSKTSQTFREPGIDPDKPLKPDDKIEEEQNKYNYLMTSDGYLMMLPQTLKDVTIDVIYELDGEKKSTTYNLPSDIVWEPGKKYIYKFGEDLEEVVVYYEKYADGTYGFHNEEANPRFNPLDDVKEIAEAGYGVLTKSTLVSKTPIIKLGTTVATTKKTAVPGGYSLYAVSQTSIAGSATFPLTEDVIPSDIYFDGNGVLCGRIIPHFAKGARMWSPNAYSIRTPQQMRNISALTIPNNWGSSDKTFIQERDLNFAVRNVGGEISLPTSVVDEFFAGTYEGNSFSISNVTISASGSDKVGLFSESVGKLKNIILKSSSITGQNYVGGIVGHMYGQTAEINQPQVIGTSESTPVNITGVSKVGGIVGWNQSVLTGNSTKEEATQTTVAEVSGWVKIIGTGSDVGGIVGRNEYYYPTTGSINTVLVYGVYVTGSKQGDFIQSKIEIKGADNVGGVAGWNQTPINGNVTGSVDKVVNMPDVAGIVEIRGVNNVGGIVGKNEAAGRLNSVNVRSGRETAMIINGTGDAVGGIVGQNEGQIGLDSDDTFISTRGNIAISGNNFVGGIVGSNASTAELKNGFVYDYYNPLGARKYYAPTIKSNATDVGGIVGSNSAPISSCSVFSSSGTLLTISSKSINVGGIVGANLEGGGTTNCSVVGSVKVESMDNNVGGISGINKEKTSITTCWVGSTDGYGIISNAVKNLGLIIAETPVYGTPVITGQDNIGGIVGLNDGGTINEIELNDNVVIGKADVGPGNGSNSVGGIAGGNTVGGVITGCEVFNSRGRIVTVQGSRNLGGIVGLCNGSVLGCTVSGSSDNFLNIIGLGAIGGIVGQLGGHKDLTSDPKPFGDDNTTIKNCSVIGFVTLKGNTETNTYLNAKEVGGIVGLTGPNKNNIMGVENCTVGKGGAVNISVDSGAGGIVGTNAGNIKKCDVYNATIVGTGHTNAGTKTLPFAGGIAGITITNSSIFNSPAGTYRSDIIDCRVYSGTNVSTYYWSTYVAGYAGALVGHINSSVSMVFGQSGINSVSNTGVKVNRDYTPTKDNYIFGYNTGDGSTTKATINHDMFNP